MEIDNTLTRLREATTEINRASNDEGIKSILEKTWILQDRLAFPDRVRCHAYYRFMGVHEANIRSRNLMLFPKTRYGHSVIFVFVERFMSVGKPMTEWMGGTLSVCFTAMFSALLLPARSIRYTLLWPVSTLMISELRRWTMGEVRPASLD